MIKNIKFLFLSFLLCAPFVAGAADHCTNPNEYTIDRRCYVTEEQKKQKPFSSVVRVRVGPGICTGTLATFDEDAKTSWGARLNLFTAAHCSTTDSNKRLDELDIELQNGSKQKVKFVDAGEWSWDNSAHREGYDWAIYRPQQIITGIQPVFIANRELSENEDVMVVGYGALKIMSDAEIEDFRQRYFDYMAYNKGVNFNRENADVYVASDRVQEFISNCTSTSCKVFWDYNHLKISRCKYKNTNCQGYSGNSGGPWFDSENNLVGITSTGYPVMTTDPQTYMPIAGIADADQIYESGNSTVRAMARMPQIIDNKRGSGEITQQIVSDAGWKDVSAVQTVGVKDNKYMKKQK